MGVSIIDKNRKNKSGVSVDVIKSNGACTQFNTDNADYHNKTKTHGKNKQTNKQKTHTWKQELKRKKHLLQRERGKDELYFVFPSGRFGRLSVPIPEVQYEFTEHAVNFQK